MRRWHQDVRAMRKQKRVWRLSHEGWGGSTRGEYPERSMGQFRKRHALDCGKPKCMICHSEKQLKYKRRDEEEADLKLKEQIRELGEK